MIVLGGDEPRWSVADAARMADGLDLAGVDIVYFGSRIRPGPRRRTETPEGLEQALASGFLTRLVVLDRIHQRLAGTSSRLRIVLRARAGQGYLGAVADLNQAYSYYSPERCRRNAVAGNEALVLGAAERYPGLAVSAFVSRLGRLPAEPPPRGLFDSRGRLVPASYGFDARHAAVLLRVGEKMVQRAAAAR